VTRDDVAPTETATREHSRVALVTCAALPDLDPDNRLLADALVARGVPVSIQVWDDPAVDWSAYRLVVLRAPWDYPPRRDEFVRWAARVPHVANPADVVAWNTDKRYLRDLAEVVPVIPTTWIEPGGPIPPLPDAGTWVVKPAVGAGAVDTGRYDLPAEADLLAGNVKRVLDSGRVVMLQPYLAGVDTAGETALIYLADTDGRLGFSHAARKAAVLTGPDVGVSGLGLPQHITPASPAPAELALAERVLAAVPGGPDRLLYARVDLVPDDAGAPTLIELELTEPSLFLEHAPAAARRLAAAIHARLGD
jgi:hypothetical protein